MKRILSAAVLTAIIFNIAAACIFIEASAAASAEIYLDFEDYTGGNYKNFQLAGDFSSNVAPGTDPEGKRGGNVCITAMTASDGPRMNWSGAGNIGYADNNIWGYSIYATEATNHRINMKFRTASGSDGWISPLLTLNSGSIQFCGRETIPINTSGEWLDIRTAMDFDNHKAFLYVNGQKLAECDMDASFAYTLYNNVNFSQSTYSGVSYLDDFVEYSSALADITAEADGKALGSAIVSCGVPYIDVSFGIEAEGGAVPSVQLRKKNGASAAFHAEYTYRRDYMTSYPTGARIYLDEWLDSESEYELEISEKDLAGRPLEKTVTFFSESTEPQLLLTYNNTVLNQNNVSDLPAGTKVSFNFSTYRIPDDDTLEYFVNGVKKGEVDADAGSFSVYLEEGVNEITMHSVQTDVQAAPVTLEGIDYSVQVLQECDFEDGIYDGLHGITGDAAITAIRMDGQHGQSIRIDAAGSKASIYPIMPSDARGIVKLEYEALFESFFPMHLSTAVYEPENGSRADLMPLTLRANGTLTAEDGKEVALLETGRWYKLCTYYDIENKTFSFFMDDEALIYEQPFGNQNFEGISRIIIGVSDGVLYLDNFNEYELARGYRVYASFQDSDGAASPSSVNHESAQIKLHFSECMTDSELNKNITVLCSDGAQLEYSGVYDSADKAYTIIPYGLLPNREYTIQISENLRSAVGGVNSGSKEISFKTAKTGFYMSGCVLQGGDTLAELTGDRASVAVSCVNDTEESAAGVIFFGIYKGDMLYSYDTASVSLSADGDTKKTLTASLPEDVSGGGYSTEIYLLDSMIDLNVIDSFTGGENVIDNAVGSFVVEAEDMNLSNDVSVISDTAASGGRAVKVNTGVWAGTIEQASAERSFYTEQFAQRSGNYAVWLRVKCSTIDTNSVWGALNTDDYSLYEYKPSDDPDLYVIDEDYHWLNIGYIYLPKGAFHISFKYREPNFIADKLIVTNDLSFLPADMDDLPGRESQSLYPEPEVKPIAQHPRLFVTEDMIADVKNNINSEELGAAYEWLQSCETNMDFEKEISDAAGGYKEIIEIALEFRALKYLLGEYGDEETALTVKYARDYLSVVDYDTSVSDITRRIGSAMMMGAAVYDWCYDLLTDEDKDFFISVFKELASLKEIGYPPTKLSSIGSHGGEYELLRDLLSVGVAVYDEEPEIYNFAAGRIFSEYADSRKMFNKSGNHPQGTAYGSMRYECELWAALIFDRMGVKNIFGEEMREVAYKWIYERLPLGAWFKDGDDTAITKYSYFNYSLYDIRMQILSGNMFADPVLKRQYLKSLSLHNYIPESTVWFLLIADPGIAAEEVNDLPLARKTTYPLSGIVARTSWQTGLDAPTAMAQMKIQEKNLGDHMHLDSGTFQIYYKGSLATASGLYEGKNGGYGSRHYYNYYQRTISHNAVTVLDPDENVYPVPNGSSNDGGQKQVAAGTVNTYEDLMNREDLAETKGSYIGPNEYTPKFSYIKGDITNAYSDKVSSYNRSMVFMDLFDEDYPAAFVVFDKIASSDADFRKTWLMHSIEEPEIDGNITTICRTEEGFNGKLVNKTMLPEQPEIIKVEGFSVNGEEYPNSEYDGIDAETAEWRIEVSPAQANKEDTFLNAMYVTDADGNLPAPDMHMLQNGVMTGVVVKDRVVMFSDDAQTISGSFSLSIPENGYETVSCLLTDMSEGVWKITGDGGVMYALSEAGESCIYFEAEPGSYTFEMSDGALTEFEAPREQKHELGDFLVYHNGLFLNQQYPTRLEEAVPYISIDDASRYFNANAVKSADNQSADVTVGEKTYSILAGESYYIADGQQVPTAYPAKQVDGKLYIPIEEYKNVFGIGRYAEYDACAKIFKY